jgi:hypothetical protein
VLCNVHMVLQCSNPGIGGSNLFESTKVCQSCFCFVLFCFFVLLGLVSAESMSRKLHQMGNRIAFKLILNWNNGNV